MAKFRFRLATLQTLRESYRDEMRSKLAEAYQAEKLLVEQIETIHGETEDLQQVFRNTLQNPTPNVNQLLDTQRYQAVLRSQQTTLENQTKILATEIEKRRSTLVAADQQVRILDKLHERQLEAHRKHQRLAEAKVMDEIASRKQEVDL